jgi:hypothetical protein
MDFWKDAGPGAGDWWERFIRLFRCREESKSCPREEEPAGTAGVPSPDSEPWPGDVVTRRLA